MKPIVAEMIDVQKHFVQRGAPPVRAVDGLSFAVYKGETFALVGESGCGKTTAAEMLLLLQPSSGGDIRFKGNSVGHLAGRRVGEIRRQMQVVFQNPRSSLNPRLRIRQILAEAVKMAGQRLSKAEVKTEIERLLRLVKLEPRLGSRFPHEVSGGQAQRIAVARALAVKPEFLVLDEPTSALDVSVQAQVINLLVDLQQEMELTYLFISHDLRIVRHLADRVGIMYLGKMVETGATDQIFSNPSHPYTQALISAIPQPHPRLRRKRIILKGDIPSPARIPSGCRFRTRCFAAQDVCSTAPELRRLEGQQFVACHFAATATASEPAAPGA